MSKLTVFLTPTVLTFLVITAGYYFGKIKIHSMSLDLAAVLICAVAAGWFISVSPLESDTAYMSSLTGAMKNLSSLGTSLFVSSVGIAAGYSLNEFRLKNIWHFIFGGLIVITGFLLAKCVAIVDKSISVSALLGILCGSLTSTPGMMSACELSGAISEQAVLGYGSAYLFGVVFVVLFVQMLTRRGTKQSAMPNAESKTDKEIPFVFLIQIGITVIIGTAVGQTKIPISNVLLGSSGGMLIFGTMLGFLTHKYLPCAMQPQQTVSVFRNTGLVFFFVGSGIPAGLQFSGSFHFKWLLYGILFTVAPIAAGYFICRISKYTNIQTASVIAGGMTSTPAVGVLIDRDMDIDLFAYSMTYVGSLMTMVVGIKCIF